jgi:hypothetical protein
VLEYVTADIRNLAWGKTGKVLTPPAIKEEHRLVSLKQFLIVGSGHEDGTFVYRFDTVAIYINLSRACPQLWL